MKTILRGGIIAAVVLLGLQCGGGPSGPQPGNLMVRLVSPNSGADSAIILTVTGPAALTNAAAGPGLRLFQQTLGGTTTRFALTGQLNNGATILTIGVVDVGSFSQYNGTIQGVALPNYTLRNLAGYALAVTR